MTLEEFIDMVCQRPVPQNPASRIRIMAKELAEGAAYSMWDAWIPGPSRFGKDALLMTSSKTPERISTEGSALAKIGYILKFNTTHEDKHIALDPLEKEYKADAVKFNNLLDYIIRKWGANYIGLNILVVHGYLEDFGDGFTINKSCFDLLETEDQQNTKPITVFISYRRSESSAFSLLVLKYLEKAGLEPFLDMALVPGEDWHDGLKERIQSHDYFILLVGLRTLESPYVVKEIEWALEKGLDIIPIWQPGFEFNIDQWPSLSDPVKRKLSNAHTIRVLEENPLAYNSAMVELLNKFGIMP